MPGVRSRVVTLILVWFFLSSPLLGNAIGGPFGPADHHRVYAIEDITLSQSKVLLAGCGGDLNFTDVGTFSAAGFYPGRPGLIVQGNVQVSNSAGSTVATDWGLRAGGDVQLTNHTVRGSVQSGGSFSGQQSTVLGDVEAAGSIAGDTSISGEVRQNVPFASNGCIEHLAVEQALLSVSDAYGAMPDTASVGVDPQPDGRDSLTFIGVSGTNVFSVSPAQIANAASFTFDGADDAFFIINVRGGTVEFPEVAETHLGSDVSYSEILLNFPTAVTLRVPGNGAFQWPFIPGTVLAPHSTTSLVTGVIRGSLFARQITGSGDVWGVHFEGSPPPGIEEVPPPPEWTASLWIADDDLVRKQERVSTAALLDLPAAEVDTLGVDEASGVLWVYGPARRLRRFTFDGTALPEITTPAPDDIACQGDSLLDFPHVALEADHRDGSVWLGVCKTLFHFAASGQAIGSPQALDTPIRAIMLDIDRGSPAQNRRWIVTDRSVQGYDDAGNLKKTISLGLADIVQHADVDKVSGDIWIALQTNVKRYSSAGSLRATHSVSGVTRLASDDRGRAWAAAGDRLLRLGSSGGVLLDLQPFGSLKNVLALASDPRDYTAWIGGPAKLHHIALDGRKLQHEGWGANEFLASARALVVYADRFVPSIDIVEPEDGSFVGSNQPVLRTEIDEIGSGVDPSRLCGEANGSYLPIVCSSTLLGADCAPEGSLAEGQITISLSALDWEGNFSDPDAVTITVDTIPPDPPDSSKITVENDGSGVVTVSGEAGSVEPGSQVTVTNMRTGESTTVTANPDGSFSATIAAQEGDQISITATDQAGNTSPGTTKTVGAPLPPDPETVAPPVDRTTATDFASSTEFLYTGTNPIQRGVAPGTMKPERVAVVRGRVLDATGVALPAVRVSILGHPEFGETFSRRDGFFDIAVNGGGPLVVVYEGEEFLAAQRSVQVPWRDFAILPDVVLIRRDPQVTTVSAGAPGPQVARGTVQTDTDGSRQATVFFPSLTGADLVREDGSTQPLSTMSVRATEYTVGPNGPRAMPGELPATSAYTYAVELGVDEADAGGGEMVQFSQPVAFYVENFLDLPVGTGVPVGWYDRVLAAWVPSPDGRVVQIVAEDGTRAFVDTDGDGVADDAGLSLEELQVLANLYDPPQSLWRALIDHFTPYDCNYAPVAEPGAERPNPDPAKNGEKDKLKDACEQPGSIIECQNQVLGEEVEVVGTPFSVSYRSSRVLGRRAGAFVDIPLSGATVPSVLRRIDLQIDVAGRRITQSFPPLPNQGTTFEWDGRDVYGRLLQGDRSVDIRISYVYDAFYSLPPDVAASFGFPSNQRIAGDIPVRGVEIPLSQDQVVPVTVWDARGIGLGGWSLSPHHSYDPQAALLRFGDGAEKSAATLQYQVMNIFAGNGTVDFSGDGGPATSASVNFPAGLAAGPDGSVYIADTFNDRVRRVDPSGTISTVAGNGTTGFSGEGGPATLAALNAPEDVDVGPDGSLYIVDFGNNRVRRVDPDDGVITTVVGNGAPTFAGDGGPATDAALNGPRRVKVTPDGTIYVSDTGNHRIRRVTPDGIILTVAGTGVSSFSGDGGAATAAHLNQPFGVDVDSLGNLYIADRLNHRIRRVGTDGVITTVAGDGRKDIFSQGVGDGGLATFAAMNTPQGVAVAPDGILYIADSFNRRIRRVKNGIITTIAGGGTQTTDGAPAPGTSLGAIGDAIVHPDGSIILSLSSFIRRVHSALPGFSLGGDAIPSEDATELYLFDSQGRHLQTLNALTGAPLYEFEYDEDGLLSTVRDGDGNETTIERDTSGNAGAIVGPFGQRTELLPDPNGYVERITNPANESFLLTYSDDGLLETMTNPRGKLFTFGYDDLGRLERDDDPAGGSQTLVRTDGPTHYEVLRATGLGRATTYRVESSSVGDQARTNSFADGTQATSLRTTKGGRSTSLPPGTVEASTQGPDPRFGMMSPLSVNQAVTMPSGLSGQIGFTREVTLAEAHNPLSLTTLIDTTTLNGRSFMTSYDQATKSFTATTPVGVTTTSKIDSVGRLTELKVGELVPVSFTYNPVGHAVPGKLGSVTVGTTSRRTSTFNYFDSGPSKGFLKEIVDPLNRTFSFTYDGAGRVKTQTLPGGRTIGFEYDANGNLTEVRPPRSLTQTPHGLDYTAVDLLEVYDPPDVPLVSPDTTSYIYNLDRQVDFVTRPDGQTIDPEYEATTGKLDFYTVAEGVIDFTYAPATGQLEAIGHPGGQDLSFGYDGDLLTSETWSGAVGGPAGHVVAYVYDSDFRVENQSINGVHAVKFVYDGDGLLEEIREFPSDVLIEDITRDIQKGGLITATSVGTVNPITDAWTYNSFGELETYTVTQGAVTLYSLDFGSNGSGLTPRDKLGRIVDKQEMIGGVTDKYHYQYDQAGRLETVARNGSGYSSYSYDLNGRRMSYQGPAGPGNVTLLPTDYDDQDRLLNYGPNRRYTYTANGEVRTKAVGPVIGEQVTTYTYDVFGNLRHVDLPNGTDIDYVVDGRNRRVGKKVDNVLVQALLYQGQLNPVAELDGVGNVVARFAYGTKANVPDYMVKGGSVFRIVSDHLGSPRLVVDVDTGIIRQRIDYDEFGNVLFQQEYDASGSPVAPGSLWFQPFGFAGGLYDPDTKLVRFGARDYDPEVGRWTAKDPILFAGGDTNLYGYTFRDPVNFVDPDGLSSLALSLPRAFVGAAVGFGFGGPVGAGVGFGLGLALGDLLTPPSVGVGSDIVPSVYFNEGAKPQAVDGVGNPVSADELAPTGESVCEPATNRRARGGTSTQEGLKDAQGRDVTRHTVRDRFGNVVHDHYRPGPIKR